MSALERMAHLAIEGLLVYLVVEQLSSRALCWRCLLHKACRFRYERCSPGCKVPAT